MSINSLVTAIVAEAVGRRQALFAVRNESQPRHTEVVAAVVCHKGHIVSARRCGDPRFSAFDPASTNLGRHGHFRPEGA